MSEALSITAVRKRYADFPLLGGVDAQVAPSEFVALVGPSGGGKSTLLRLIAGLDTRFNGEIKVGDTLVYGPDPRVGIVFQEPRLFPWLTVTENVAFGLADPRSARSRGLLREVLDVLGLADLAAALPAHLSGGMAQRVALARALVTEPKILLLDEPFDALDPFTRMRSQDHLLAAWIRYKPTVVLVTRDLDEAVYLADRVVLVSERPGRVQDILRVAPERPRDRRDPSLLGLKVALLEALHLERSDIGVTV